MTPSVGDFNGDGWPDILCVPFPGKETFTS
jgi:hypothetical protein